jgi:hypothetical protein
MVVGMISLEVCGLKVNAMEMALVTSYIQVKAELRRHF